MIEITGIDLIEFVKEVYKLSSPQGMGFYHFTQNCLTDKEAKEIIEETEDKNTAVSMDYVKGRACKMNVFKRDGRLFISPNWYDHTDSHFEKLLQRFNINAKKAKHALACDCYDCQQKSLQSSN